MTKKKTFTKANRICIAIISFSLVLCVGIGGCNYYRVSSMQDSLAEIQQKHDKYVSDLSVAKAAAKTKAQTDYAKAENLDQNIYFTDMSAIEDFFKGAFTWNGYDEYMSAYSKWAVNEDGSERFPTLMPHVTSYDNVGHLEYVSYEVVGARTGDHSVYDIMVTVKGYDTKTGDNSESSKTYIFMHVETDKSSAGRSIDWADTYGCACVDEIHE